VKRDPRGKSEAYLWRRLDDVGSRLITGNTSFGVNFIEHLLGDAMGILNPFRFPIHSFEIFEFMPGMQD
jgi:hypothetical protein